MQGPRLWGHECLDISPHGSILEISCEQGEAPLIRGVARGPGYRLGWASGLEELGLPGFPYPILSGSPLQAGRLQAWMVSGLSPSHCPRLLALVRHTTCRCWMPSPQVAEHCQEPGRARPQWSGRGRWRDRGRGQ